MGYSSIIANVLITKSHNRLERLSQSGVTIDIRERSIHYIVIEVLDDSLKPVTVHGRE